MKKLLLFLILLSVSGLSWAAAPTRSFTYTSGQVIDPTAVTTNEVSLYTYLQAGVDTYAASSISNAAISPSAGITYGKLNLSGGILPGDINTSTTTSIYQFENLTVPFLSTFTGNLTLQGAISTNSTVGTSGQVLTSQGGNPMLWANSLSSVSDYGTSASAFTSRQGTALKVAYGTIAGVTSGGQAITNLPFTSSSSYHCVASQNTSSGTAVQVASYDSGSQMTLTASASTQTVGWICMGI